MLLPHHPISIWKVQFNYGTVTHTKTQIEKRIKIYSLKCTLTYRQVLVQDGDIENPELTSSWGHAELATTYGTASPEEKKNWLKDFESGDGRSGEERLGQGLIINATTGAATHGVLPGTELNLELLSVGRGSNSAVASAPNF